MTVGPTNDYASEAKFPPLRLAPVSRVSTDGGVTHLPVHLPNSRWTSHSGQADRPYPRIIVRDPLGRELDTFTALQEAIYRASWARKKFGEWPKTPMEWRLPKAPAPSRPDYSRSGPSPAKSCDLDARGPRAQDMTSQRYDVGSREINLTTNVLMNLPTLEIPVDDVAFVAESLNHLPQLPSFTFLRHSILAGQSTYVQIVASLLLHQRQLRARDVRNAHWSFPGFCTGCKRAGFCYGCEKNPKPHVHEDVPAMTGGGFRFWKHDRPRDPQKWKNPSTWRIPTTEEELTSIIEKYGDLAAYERARQLAENDVTDISKSGDLDRRYQRLRNLGTYPPYITIVSTDERRDSKQEEEDEGVSTVDSGLGEESRRHRSRRTTMDEEAQRRRKLGVVDFEEEGADDEHSNKEITELSEASTDRILYRVDTEFVDRLRRETQLSIKVTQKNDQPPDDQVEVDEGIQADRSANGPQSPVEIFKPPPQGGDSGSKVQGQSERRKSPVRAKKASRLEYVDKSKEAEAEEEARILRERAKENVPFGKKRNDVNYIAPNFFTVQKKSKKITVAKDPFSTDRELDVPKGGSFQLKKSTKKATQFVEFKKGDRDWKAPKQFEVKLEEKKAVKFWTGSSGQSQGKSRKGQRKAGDDEDSDVTGKKKSQKVSTDSELGSGTSGKRHLEQDMSQADKDVSKQASGASVNDSTADKTEDPSRSTAVNNAPGQEPVPEPVNPKRREIVRKAKAERLPISPPPQNPPRLPSPPPFKRRSPTPPSPAPPQSPAPVTQEVPLPELDLPEVPDLPEIEENQPENKRKHKLKFLVEPPPPQPQVTESPKKRRAPPRIRQIPRHLFRPRKSRPAEAPVTAEDLTDIQDPLDFLAKYCIINPDRLPLYEIVFESILEEQAANRSDISAPEQVAQREPCEQSDSQPGEGNVENEEPKERKSKKGTSKNKKSAKENSPRPTINPQLLPTEKGLNMHKIAMTIEEQHLEKLIYTLDLLHDKMSNLCGQLEGLEVKRTQLLAEKARVKIPEISSPNFFVKTHKKGKKGKKNVKQTLESERKLRPHEITDDIIVSRLDGKILKELCQDPDMKLLESEIDICKSKFMDVQNRVEQIAAEKLLADAFCMNHYIMRQQQFSHMPAEYRRQQSDLYNRLRPNQNNEMNLEEVEEALQQINHNLLTDKEFYFLYSVLDLPRREKINFRLFTIIAALSEKVTQLDPVVRKLINKFDYNALDIKMEKCKELFELLESDHVPKGAAQASSLAVELTAGGLRPEHTRYVMTKFNRDSKGFIDFLDFVTYVPLFVEIHQRIITDPLNGKFDL